MERSTQSGHCATRRPRRTVDGYRFRWEFGDATRGSSLEGGRGVTAGRSAGVLLVCTLLLAACSSGENAAPSTTTTDTATTEPAAHSTTPSPVSSTSTSTVAPTTTSTDVPTTSTVPPTTVDPAVEVSSAASAAVDKAIADFTACLNALPNCDIATLAASRANPLLAVNAGRVSQWNLAGYVVADRDQFRYVIESVDVADDFMTATVTICYADGSKLVDPGAGPGGADLVIDGTFSSGREAWDMRLDPDGVWRAYDAPLVGGPEATDVCPAA